MYLNLQRLLLLFTECIYISIGLIYNLYTYSIYVNELLDCVFLDKVFGIYRNREIFQINKARNAVN